MIKQKILSGVDASGVDVALSDIGFCIHINRLVAITKGGGRKALAQMCANADRMGVYLSLNACPVRSAVYPERMSEDELVAWYEGFGFKRVPRPPEIQEAVFDYMSHLMLRYAVRN